VTGSTRAPGGFFASPGWALGACALIRGQRSMGRTRTWHEQDVGSKRSSRPNKNLPYQTAQLSPLKQRQTKPHRELPLTSRPERLRPSAHVIGMYVCMYVCMLVALLYDAILDMLRGRAGLRRSVNAHKICQVCRLLWNLAALCTSLQRLRSGGWNAPELLLTSTCLPSAPHDTLHGSR
jgi:hypothetical protein